MDIRIRGKGKNRFLAFEGEQVVPKNIIELRHISLVTSASSLSCMAIQWGSLNMDISPILVF